MATFFLKQGTTTRLTDSRELQITETLPVGNYQVKFNPLSGYYFEDLDVFTLPKKLYGGVSKDADRIIETFFRRPNSTGVLLAGEKGSGKTMLTKLISTELAKQQVPTIVVSEPFSGSSFNGFLAEIDQPCVVLFDEFEKVYPPAEQQQILTLMDGIFSSRKLFLVTVNDKYKLDENMRNRPGRLFYMIDYEGLSQDFIRGFCEDTLINQTHVAGVGALASMFWRFNFDMLQAIVEEMNRYDESPSEALRLLNCKPDGKMSKDFTFKLKRDGVVVGDDRFYNGSQQKWSGRPLMGPVSIHMLEPDEEGDLCRDYHCVFDTGDLVSMNPADQTYHFKNKKGEEVLLKEYIPTQMGYRDVLSNESLYAGPVAHSSLVF
jgi:hypothetical protein